MTIPDPLRHVVYGLPSASPYMREIQKRIGKELRARSKVPQGLPYRLLVIMMQLKELDRKRKARPELTKA